MNIENSIDLDKHLAIAQMKHYLHLQQSANAVADHGEYRRATVVLDHLVKDYGVSALNTAKEEYK